ncbi:phage tail-like protein [Catenulispora sp. GP43]|uniref:phage tail protein n=1 Tax=Catenulispora sp. GP43 TaxID=3156263 RepID=UPI003514DB11
MTIDMFTSAAGQGGGQLAGALAPAAGTGLSTGMSAARALKGADSAFPLYGLAMRFIVTFSTETGSERLGEWSSCTGLQVGFESEEIEVGGEYSGKVLLPKRMKYAPVVLERAMEHKTSQALQTWLDKLVKNWVNRAAGAMEPPKGIVLITLQDCQQNPVCSWALHNAVPVSWHGPDLKASDNGIALEKLTLAHEGFLPHTSTPEKAGEGNAQLSMDADRVVFHYNPTAITITRTAADVPAGDPGVQTSPGSTGNDSDGKKPPKAETKTTVTLESVVFDGDGVESTCNRLIGWTFLKRISAGSSTQKWQLPRLQFRWGKQKSLSVYLTAATVKYTRFSSAGTPVRASVTLTLQEVPGSRPGTNPTSGGLPGRRTHVLTGAETLPGLATRTYGGPGRWREIAAANGFDDPLRVRPGTAVYLPSAQESMRENVRENVQESDR